MDGGSGEGEDGYVFVFDKNKAKDVEVQLTGTSGFNFGIGADTKYTFRFDPVQDKYFWRAIFKSLPGVGVDIHDTTGIPSLASEVKDVHFDSILAADLIVGGVLRLETGLSI